jgi:hypothetical protein
MRNKLALFLGFLNSQFKEKEEEHKENIVYRLVQQEAQDSKQSNKAPVRILHNTLSGSYVFKFFAK